MDERRANEFEAVVVGVSAGGFKALKELLGGLPADFPLPVLIVQHLAPTSGPDFAELLDNVCPPKVKEADEGEFAAPGTVYLAPANYHLLLEKDGSLSLSTDPAVSYSRPSIDVLFESAAEACGAALIGIVLTGANYDGSAGLERVKALGGFTIVQDPNDAEVNCMPQSALERSPPDRVLPLGKIAALLRKLAGPPVGTPGSRKQKGPR